MKKYLLSLIAIIFTGITSFAQTHFEDPQGNFVMDLYDDLEFQAQQHSTLYTFKSGYSLIMLYDPEKITLDGYFYKAINMLKEAGLNRMKEAEPVKEMQINGLPAKIGKFTSVYESNGIKVVLTGIPVAYQLENAGIYAILILNNQQLKSQDLIYRTLYSLRLPGQNISGVINMKEVNFDLDAVPAKTSVASNEPAILEHDGLKISFPAGWTVTPKGRSDSQDIIGKFANENINSSAIIMGMKGLIWNKKLVEETAQSIGLETFPGSKLRKKEEVKLENKKKGKLSIFDGVVVADGQELEMSLLTFTQKAGKYHLIYIVTGPATSAEKMEKDTLLAANSLP